MREKGKLFLSMIIFGSIGVFVHYISLPSAVISCARAIIGTLVVLAIFLVKGKKLSLCLIKQNALYLLLLGTALGFKWILLFEAYRYTTVAVATLCYYMAPVFVVVLSPLVLKEKMTAVKLICTAVAVVGAVLISGVSAGQVQGLKGIGFGLAAAALYCMIILLNKKIHGLDGTERTLCQLSISAIVMIVYVALTQDLSSLSFTPRNVVLLIVVGVIHTGLVYYMYFPSVGKLPAQTSSVLSYIDPVTAIILSALVLSEPMTAMQVCGTVFILGSTLVNELSGGKGGFRLRRQK